MKRKVDPKKLEKITDIEIVLKYINDMYDDIMFNDGNKEVKIEDYIKNKRINSYFFCFTKITHFFHIYHTLKI